MNKLLGSRGKTDDDEVTTDYNQCVAEIKEENPYIGQLALHQEAMKRVAQRRAAKHGNNQNNAKEDFTPQRISFNRSAPKKNDNNGNSLNRHSLSRSVIEFLSSSTSSYNTVKISNKTNVEESHGKNTVMPGRRTSTYNEEDAGHITTAMRDIELSDSEEEENDTSVDESNSSRRSSVGRRLSSFKRIPSLNGTMRKRHSAHKRQSSSSSSISTLQRYSSDLSKDSTAEKSEESRNGDDEKSRHKPPENNNTDDSDDEKQEKQVMDFVEKFMAKSESVNPTRSEKPTARVRGRRSSLCSVEENKALVTSGESVSRSITSLGEGSVVATADGSLICSWGRRSLTDSEVMGDGGDLICNWDSRHSILSNSSAASNSVATRDRREFPSEINVGINADDGR